MEIFQSALVALSSSLGGALLTYFLYAKKEHEWDRRKKIEQLYETFSAYARETHCLYDQYRYVIAGDLCPEDFEERFTKKSHVIEGRSDPLDTSEMLINVYFPNLRPKFREVLKAKNGIQQAMKTDMRQYYGLNNENREFGEEFRNQYTFWCHAVNTLKADILKEARVRSRFVNMIPKYIYRFCVWVKRPLLNRS
jgi:hypothetical protein